MSWTASKYKWEGTIKWNGVHMHISKAINCRIKGFCAD